MANRVKEDEKNERIIRNLLKLSENRRCINCNSLGPQYVCTNFSTFICTTCSGIHREFTHRVKSVSMAKFTPQEVSALQGGGNANAREIYLKEWDPQRNSLPDGSNVERLRDFIKHVYVDRRYTGERNMEKPPRAKMGETEDFNGNRKTDTYQGGSRSPPYDDRRGDRSSPGGRSPAYDQDNRQSSDYRRSPARAEIVNDWRREDRFGNGRKSEDRNSDGGSRLEARSPDSQKDSDMASPPVVRPVRDILGENVSPLRVIEPPKTQRSASSSSLASSDANPSTIKVEASFIDFDDAPEPPVPVTVQQTQQAASSSVQPTASTNNDWANFDSVPEVKTNTAASNSVESLLSGLSIPTSSSGPSAHLGNISSFQSSGSQGSSFGLPFGSTAPPSGFPAGGAPASSLGPAPQLVNDGGTLLTNAPTGGQWPTMNPQQHSLFPGGINPPVSQLLTPVTGGSSSNKPWNPLAPNAYGPPGIPVQVGQAEKNPAIGTSFGFKMESNLDGQSGGRKALPEDLFAMNYSYTPSAVPGWYSGSPYVAAVPMHYNAPMAVPNNFQAVSRSTNPFDVGSEPSPVQASTFPSMASLQGALPKAATPSGATSPPSTMASSICKHSPIIPHSPTTAFASTKTSLRPFFLLRNGRPATAVRCSLRRPEYIPNHIPDPKYVRIFDTTLRDGEQSPGATMTTKEKLDIARQLARLGVDIIEAGFPASSEADFEAVKLIAAEVGNIDSDHVPVICGLARCNKRDIERSWEAVKHAKKPRIHTFIATSEIHMKYKLKMTEEQVIEKARSMVAYARSLGCNDVEFSPEDAGRSEREFLYQILGEVIKAGATTLNIPDTVGYTLPAEFGQLIADIKANTPGIENVIISTHCQNDLGLSTANTLAGAVAGARQLEVTINGIGERAGNASLEEVVMALKCRGEQVLSGLHTGINTQHIIMASKMVEEYSGLRVQPHKAIVGANAFAHESGIHQDGMLKHKNTYEIISPEDVGLLRSNESGIVLGKLSGRHALKAKMLELGYDIDGKELDDLFSRFKAVAGNKKIISDDDLVALVSDEVFQPQVVWKLEGVQVTCGSLGLSTATVKLTDANGDEHISCSVGTGPVDAAYKAVDLIVKVPVTLQEYTMTAVTEGIDAIATTRVLIRGEDSVTATHALTGKTINRAFSGTGASMDIVISSVRAYIGALNKLLGFKDRLKSEDPSESKVVSAFK